MLSEVSQAEKDKYHMISLICGIFFFFKFERKRESTSKGGVEREEERERIPSSLHAVSMEPIQGLNSETMRS